MPLIHWELHPNWLCSVILAFGPWHPRPLTTRALRQSGFVSRPQSGPAMAGPYGVRRMVVGARHASPAARPTRRPR